VSFKDTNKQKSSINAHTTQMKKRNSDFKGTPVILPDLLSPHWPIAGFKHLRPEHKILLPKVTLDQVEAYYFTL
jgi:hypothetical protein